MEIYGIGFGLIRRNTLPILDAFLKGDCKIETIIISKAVSIAKKAQDSDGVIIEPIKGIDTSLKNKESQVSFGIVFPNEEKLNLFCKQLREKAIF